MYLKDYIKKFGHLSFKERPFCDVDAAVLAAAVYTNLEVVAPSINDTCTYQAFFKNISSYDMSIVMAGQTLMMGNKKAIPLLKDSIRFGDIGIKYVYKVFNVDLANQFYACTFIVPDVGTVVAFRGTDVTTAAWEEDLNTSIRRVVFAQLDALDYLEVVAKKTKGPLYIVGHSKGGNLALYSSLHTSKEVRDRLVNIYSFDGNGLRDDFNDTEAFKSIKDKMKYVCPYDTIVGTIMYNPNEKIVLKSKAISVFQHDPYSWKISDDGQFVTVPSISEKAIVRTIFFRDFMLEVSQEDKTLLIKFIIEFLGGSSKTLYDFFLYFGKLHRLASMWRKLTKEQKESVKASIAKLRTISKQATNTRKLDKKNNAK